MPSSPVSISLSMTISFESLQSVLGLAISDVNRGTSLAGLVLRRRGQSDLLSQPHESLNSFTGLAQDILRRAPSARFAEHHHSRATEPEDRFLRAPPERVVQRVHLDDSPDRQRSDLHKSKATEISAGKNLCLSLIAEQDVRLALKGIPVNGPESAAKAFVLECFSIIGIMEVVVIDRRQSRHDGRTSFEGSRTLGISKQ